MANGKETSIPGNLNPLWLVSPLKEESMHNTPPFLMFEPVGNTVQGPTVDAKSLTPTTSTPLPLTVWVAGDAKVLEGTRKSPPGPPITITWSKFRGPGAVTCAKEKPPLERAPPGSTVTAKFNTTATFSEPSGHLLEVTANDWSDDGGRGFQCGWINAQVQVTVKT